MADVHIRFDDLESGRGYRKDTYNDGTRITCAIVAEGHRGGQSDEPVNPHADER